MTQQPSAPRPARPVIDPAEVRRLIDHLTALEARDPRGYAEALADNIMDPDPAETAAFRSDALAIHSLAAARYLIDNTESVMRQKKQDKATHRRREFFLQNVTRERRVLEAVVEGIRAKQGHLPTARNPRRRALQRLADENLKADVPKGRFRDILEEEKELARQAEEARKAARKEAKKAARRRRSSSAPG